MLVELLLLIVAVATGYQLFSLLCAWLFARWRRRELARPGDRVVVTAGIPFDTTGTTNLLKVETV